jgi:hypothetical protein
MSLHFGDPRVSQVIMRAFEGRSSYQFPQFEREVILHQLIKVHPQQYSPKSVVTYLDALIDFADRPPLEKARSFPQFQLFLQHLDIREYTLQPKAREIFFSKIRNSCYLRVLIVQLISVSRDVSLPFRLITLKPCRKVLVLSASETAEFIIHGLGTSEPGEPCPERELLLHVHNFLQSLIEDDASDSFLTALCDLLPGYRFDLFIREFC